MAQSRLSYLLAQGDPALPATGPIAVWAPRAGRDLSPLSVGQCDILTRFQPDHAWFSARGHPCHTLPQRRYGASLVCIPRARDAARDLIARAAEATDGPVIVDGAKTDGIESLYKDCRRLVPVSDAVSKAHGKAFWFDAASARPALTAWRATPGTTPEGYHVQVGLFSADGVDPGSALLAAALPRHLGAHVIDLGAGWGYLSAQALATRADITRIDLVEADQAALDCARQNVVDPRARFHWADATAWRPDRAADAVILNPPFHTGRDTDPGLGQAFLRTAAACLKPSGSLWLVANRHLPYDTQIAALFRTVQEMPGDNRFKVLHASRPARPRG